jgi:hypothetical protein
MTKSEVSSVNSSILRQIWNIVEQTQSTVLLRLSDMDLVKQLLSQLSNQTKLSKEELNTVSLYLSSRTALIRDLAAARSA